MNEMRKLIESIEKIDENYPNVGGVRRGGHYKPSDVRKVTIKLHELMDEGMMDPRTIADGALNYMSEADVADMARAEDWLFGIEDEDEFEESVEILGEEPLHEYREDDQEDIANELEDIKNNIANLMHEAANLVDGTDEREAARAYWIGNILGALDDQSSYMGGSMTTMQDSIDAIREGGEGEDDFER